MLDKMDANQAEMKADREERKAEMKAYREEMRAGHEEMMAKLDAHHERMMACLGKMEATDLEANPEEMQSEVVHWEVPKEEATVNLQEH
jgi:FtsZ-binding cell division protein ZapB